MLKKWLLRILISLCGALFALLISVLLLATNPSGSLKLFASLTKPFAKTVHYQRFSGTLAHHFVIDGLHITTKQYDLQIAQLSCTWQPLALLHFTLLLDQLILSDVYMTILPAWSEGAKVPGVRQLPGWLPKLDIHNFYLHHILINEASNHFSTDNILVSLQLAKQKIQTQISWQNMQLDSPHTLLNSLRLNGSAHVFGDFAHYHWGLNLHAKPDIHKPHLQLQLSGTGTERDVNLNWTIHIARLSDWLPKGSGAIFSQGHVLGNWQVPELHAVLEVDQLHAFDFSLHHLHAAVQVHDIKQQGDADLTLQGLAYQKYLVQSLRWQLQGTLAHQVMQFACTNNVANFAFHLTADYANQRWHGILTDLNLNLQNLATWQQQAPLHLFFAKDDYAMQNPLCLKQGSQSVCMKVIWQKQHKMLQFDTSPLNLFLWRSFLPESLDLVYGRAQLNAHMMLDKQHPLGSVKLRVWPVKITYQLSKNNVLPINIDRANLVAEFSTKEASVMGRLNSNWGNFMLQGRLPEWLNASHDFFKQTIEGNIKWQLNNLAPLNNQWAAIQNVQGAALAQVSFSGIVHDPKINAAFHLHDASLNIVPLNMVLKNIKLSVTGWLDNTLKIMAEADATEGHLNAVGEIHQLFSNPEIKLNLFGKNVLLANLPEYKLSIEPHIQLQYQKPTLKLSGAVFVPKAQIKLIDYEKKVVSVSSDVKYVDATPWPIQFFANLTVMLGNAVDFHYGGLGGLLGGQVKLQAVPDRTTTAIGKFTLLKGVYAAYGQSLAIQKGSAEFRGGDVTDPELTMEASKLIRNVVSNTAVPGYAVTTRPDGSLTVGVLVSGPLSHYQVQLFSDPPGLDQTDILSFLILGTPAVNAGSGGGQLLLSAASALTSKNSGQLNPLTQLKNQLQETLGLSVDVGNVSQYNATTQSIDQTTGLILSKRLSPKLSINYNAGIGQAINQFEARYQINKNWMAQTNSSNLGNGGDIFYTINK